MKPQITTYTVNYASPVALASKICMTVFQSTRLHLEVLQVPAVLQEVLHLKIRLQPFAQEVLQVPRFFRWCWRTIAFCIFITFIHGAGRPGSEPDNHYGGTLNRQIWLRKLLKTLIKKNPRFILKFQLLNSVKTVQKLSQVCFRALLNIITLRNRRRKIRCRICQGYVRA